MCNENLVKMSYAGRGVTFSQKVGVTLRVVQIWMENFFFVIFFSPTIQFDTPLIEMQK